MISFRFAFPGRVLVGVDLVRAVAREMRRSGIRRVLLVAQSGLAAEPAQRVREGLEDEGLSIVVFSSIDSDSLTGVAEEARDIGKAGFVDSVVGFGGASAMGLARLTAALLPRRTSGGSGDALDADELLDSRRAVDPGVPFVAVPNLPFDPMLCSPSCLVVDARNRRIRLLALTDAPYMVASDSQFLRETTMKQIAIAAAGAVLVSIEGLFSPNLSAISRATHAEAVRRGVVLIEELGLEGSEMHRDRMIEEIRDIGLLAAIGASGTGPGPGTVASAIIQAKGGIDGLATASALAPPFISLAAGRFPEAAAEIGVLLDAGGPTGDILETRLREIFAGAELALRLRDLGVDDRDLSGVEDNVETTGVIDSYGGGITTADIRKMIESSR